MPIDLTPLIAHVPAWLLVLFRLSGIFLFAPLFGSSAVPVRIRVMLAVGLSLCVYPALVQPGAAALPLIAPLLEGGLGLWSVVGVTATELMVGLVIGFGASLPLTGMQLAGHIIDQQIGLGLAGVFNPDLNEQGSVVGEFLFMMALTVFLVLGGHRILLSTLVGSFSLVPLGGFVPGSDVLQLIMGLMTVMFDLALRVAGPLLCLIFLQTVALGFIARTVPQLNILSIGFPLRILVGAGILVLSVASLNDAFLTAMRGTLGEISGFFSFVSTPDPGLLPP